MLKISLLANKIRQGFKTKKSSNKTAKVLLIAILIMAAFLLLTPVFAQQQDITGLRYAEATGLSSQDIRITIAKLIRIFFGLLGLVAVIIIMYGGFTYMTSAGNPEKIDKAKKVLIGAVIGLIICLTAFAIVQFVLQALLEGLPSWGEGPSPYGGGGGALGAGIVESHYPLRNATGVPRNTNIVVTFKEQICISYIVDNNGTAADLLDDKINKNSVRIYKKPEPGQDPAYLTNVRANYTPDQKTFIFKPLELLGSSAEPMVYVVELTSNIRKQRPYCSTGAFGAFGSYTWSFTVSTIVDLTPPQILSTISLGVRPEPGKTVPRNNIIQLNFNEPINPLTLQGKVLIDGNATVGSLSSENTADFIKIYVEPNTNNDQFIGGEFLISNQYKTVEFVTTDLCGKNSCGGDVFCLPGDKAIGILTKAATLAEPDKPTALLNPNLPRFYDGIIDMADNSLDGNFDEKAQGPGTTPFSLNDEENKDQFRYITNPDQGDSIKWNFNTNNVIDLVPPQILSYLPVVNAAAVDPDSIFRIVFDKYMMSGTLKPDSGYDIQEEYITLVQPPEIPVEFLCGYCIAKEDDPDDEQTTVLIYTNGLGEDLKYGLRAGSGIKDLTQNCYLPCAGPECVREPGVRPGEYSEGDPWDTKLPESPYPSCQRPEPAP